MKKGQRSKRPPPAEQTAGPDVTAELKQQIRVVSQRISELESERRKLEDVRNELLAEQKALDTRIGTVERETDRLDRKLASKKKSVDEIEVEIQAAKQEIPLLQRRCAETSERTRELTQKSGDLERWIEDFRNTSDASTSALDGLRDSIARMNKKLLSRETKGEP